MRIARPIAEEGRKTVEGTSEQWGPKKARNDRAAGDCAVHPLIPLTKSNAGGRGCIIQTMAVQTLVFDLGQNFLLLQKPPSLKLIR